MQQACFLATLTMYLEHERLITVEELEGFFAGKYRRTASGSVQTDIAHSICILLTWY